jgi:hypothetical protein
MKESMPISIRLSDQEKNAILEAGERINPSGPRTFASAIRELLSFYQKNQPKITDEEILVDLELQIKSMKTGPLKLSGPEINEMELTLEKAKLRVIQKKKNHFLSQIKLVITDG